MPSRTGTKGRGKFQIDRVLPEVGRLKLSSGVTTKRDFIRRDDMILRLSEQGHVDVLLALKERKLTIDAVFASFQKTGTTSLAALTVKGNLWEAIDKTLPSLGRSPETRHRYDTSLSKLEDCGVLGPDTKVTDLAKAPWEEIRQHYKGPADWNHMRRALGTFLSKYLGSKTHPLRDQIMGRIAAEKEPEHTPDISVAEFWSAVALLPEWARFPVICLAFSAVRIGEYIYAEAGDLKPNAREWRVQGKSGSRTVSIPAAVWHVFVAAIPARYAPKPKPGQRNSSSQRYQQLAKAWLQVTRALNLECTLHDLRHLAAQLAEDKGAGLAAIQQQLGHTTLDMTGRYAKRRMRRLAADATAEMLQQDSRAGELMRTTNDEGSGRA